MATCKKLVKIGSVVLELCEWTDRQTDNTHVNTARPSRRQSKHHTVCPEPHSRHPSLAVLHSATSSQILPVTKNANTYNNKK